MEDKTKECPCCENHCPPDELRCGRGRKYFGASEEARDAERRHRGEREEEPQTAEDEALLLLRKCGHYLHHSARGVSARELLGVLSEEEKGQLIAALKKCLGAWSE